MSNEQTRTGTRVKREVEEFFTRHTPEDAMLVLDCTGISGWRNSLGACCALCAERQLALTPRPLVGPLSGP